MHIVSDNLTGSVRIQSRAHHARAAMGKACHGIIHVRKMMDSLLLYRLNSRIVIGRRVTDGHNNPGLPALGSKRIVRQFFGRKRNDFYNIFPRLYQFVISLTNVFLSLRTFFRRTDERAFHVCAQYPCAARLTSHRFPQGQQGVLHLIPFARHGRGQKARNAGLGLHCGHFHQPVHIRVHRVITGTTVDMHIYKARRHVLPLRVDYLCRLRNILHRHKALYLFTVTEQRPVRAENKISLCPGHDKPAVFNC